MPELPEVENFRRLLLPLAAKSETLFIDSPSPNPPRSFLTADQVELLSGKYHVKDVLRRGKLICMVLDCIEKVEGCTRKLQIQVHVNGYAARYLLALTLRCCLARSFLDNSGVYLFLHMKMTGRISTPSYVPSLESLNDSEYPPSHTYLTFKTDSEEACFSDPRKFGSVTLSTTLSAFEELAPDALTDFGVEQLVGQSAGIKAILLNQKRVVAGVGNWVADEVLYQTQLHPEQSFLTLPQATLLKEKLHLILNTAISCLDSRQEFPASWLFHARWGKRSANSGNKVTDPQGRNIAFLKAAGRTSAIVPSIQIKSAQKSEKKRKNAGSRETRKGDIDSSIDEATTTTKKAKKHQQQTKSGKARARNKSPVPEKLRRRSSRLSGSS